MRARRLRLGPTSRAAAAATTLLVGLSLVPTVLASASGGGSEDGVAAGARPASAHKGLRDVALVWPAIAQGFSSPTQVTSAPDGTKRLFVVQKGGQVRVVRKGHVLAKPYLSIGRRVTSSGSEQGLLSIAFSPSFRRDHLLWVAYARASDGDLVVARMKARRAGAGHVGSKTLRPILRVEHSSEPNHYGGQLAFSGRRLLIGVGDGGGGGDPFNHAQDRDTLLGKILRIDPYDSCRGRAYCIPSGNPFANKKGRDEIWLMGLRNPWRFSVDPRTNDLWIGDVGQDRFEEIDRVRPHPRRINLGWSCWEGRTRYNASRCRAKAEYLQPKVVIRHPMAESITGGFVYRGHRYSKQIGGAYVFADFISKRVWLHKSGAGKVQQRQRLAEGATSFGVDDRGEIYAVTYDGVLHRMRVKRR